MPYCRFHILRTIRYMKLIFSTQYFDHTQKCYLTFEQTTTNTATVMILRVKFGRNQPWCLYFGSQLEQDPKTLYVHYMYATLGDYDEMMQTPYLKNCLAYEVYIWYTVSDHIER